LLMSIYSSIRLSTTSSLILLSPSYFSMLPRPPTSTLFPYTTLFRSLGFRLGDIPVPVRYFDEASSINFRRSCVYGLRTLGTVGTDRKSTRLNSSHEWISYAVFCLKKKKHNVNAHTWARENRQHVRRQ